MLLLLLSGLVLLELQCVSIGLLQSVGNSEIIGLLLSLQGLKSLLLDLVMLTVSISGLLCPRLELLVTGGLGISELLVTGSLGSSVGLHELIEVSFMGRAVGGDRITVCGNESLQSLLKGGTLSTSKSSLWHWRCRPFLQNSLRGSGGSFSGWACLHLKLCGGQVPPARVDDQLPASAPAAAPIPEAAPLADVDMLMVCGIEGPLDVGHNCMGHGHIGL